ncbi:MAG: hypothetical protein ACP5IG_04385 [Candidatus Micrarchaeia archaeon]
MIFLKKRRGQAFETMMLVISVIVAIAILGVLTGILGGIGGIGGDWRDAVKDSLKQVGTYGVSAAKTITIKKGDSLDAKAATSVISTFSSNELLFVLSKEARKDFTLGDNRENSEIIFNKGSNQDYSMAVAANADATGDHKIWVCLSRTTEKGEDSATGLCRNCRDKGCD